MVVWARRRILAVGSISLVLATLGTFQAWAVDDSLNAPLVQAGDQEKAEAAFQKGHAALDARDVRAAENCYRKAIEFDPGCARYHRQLSLLLTREDRGQEAEREILVALHLDPTDWHSLLVYGTILHLERRFDQEINTYKKVLPLLPASQKALHDKLTAFIHTDEIALKRQTELDKKRKEWEEKQYKDAY